MDESDIGDRPLPGIEYIYYGDVMTACGDLQGILVARRPVFVHIERIAMIPSALRSISSSTDPDKRPDNILCSDLDYATAELIAQSVLGIARNAQKGAPKANSPEGEGIVPPEGEIPGKVVKKPEETGTDHPGVTEEDNPFDGVDEENSVDLSDMEDPKPEGDAPKGDDKPVTHEDARVAVNKARDRGIGAAQIKAILTGMGFNLLNDVPAEKLPEFIAKVEAL